MSTAAVTLRARVGLREAAVQSLLLARRRLVALRANPAELAGTLLFPLVFLALFVYVFGGAVAGSTHAYLQFALPGMLAQWAVLGSQQTGVALNTDISSGIFDRFRALPIARSAPLVGQLLNDVLRMGLAIVVLLGYGTVLGFRVQTDAVHAVAAFAVMLAFAFAFGWAATLLGVVAKNPVVVQLFGQALMFPLTFASSAFVPARTLPGWMRAWVDVSPVSTLSDTLRGLLLGGHVLEPGLKTLAWAAAILVVFAPLSVRAYLRRA